MGEILLKLTKELENIEKGIYVYCIARGNMSVNLGKIGIEQNEVYAINYKDICAVVHECPASPYNSENPEVVKSWVRTHQEVIEKASELFGTVLPMTFDMIIKGSSGNSPNDNIFSWLKEEYNNFRAKLNKLKDKQEFGIQIFWDRDFFSEKIAAENAEIRKLKDALKNESKGKAYFIEQKIKNLLKAELDLEADRHFKTFYGQIRKHADDIKADKVKKGRGWEMLANLSCLVQKNKVYELGAELDKIKRIAEFSARFTGPWPPYSFVSKQNG